MFVIAQLRVETLARVPFTGIVSLHRLLFPHWIENEFKVKLHGPNCMLYVTCYSWKHSHPTVSDGRRVLAASRPATAPSSILNGINAFA